MGAILPHTPARHGAVRHGNRVSPVTLFLVRHGSAGMRHDGDPSDTERHLDAVGLRQAVQIAKLLHAASEAGPPIDLVLSSPAARCIETVEPLASAVGCEVEPADALFEGTDIEDSWKLLEAVTTEDASAVLCSHGDVIPELIRRAKLRGMDVPGKAGCSKGSIWTLDWDGERFTTGTYLPNPA